MRGRCLELGEHRVVGGRNRVAREKILGKRLARLELGRVAARPEAGQPGAAKDIDDPRG